MLCLFGVFLAFVAVLISLLFTLFVAVHRMTNFLVNLFWDNKYSDSVTSGRPSLLRELCASASSARPHEHVQ